MYKSNHITRKWLRRCDNLYVVRDADMQKSSDVFTLIRYPWLAYQLEEHGIPTILTNFPDPVNARESIWKSFVCDVLQADENTILIGHSSGAACSMRY